MMKNYYDWSIFNTYRAFRHRRRAIVYRLAAWLAKKSSLMSRPKGFAQASFASAFAVYPITHCLGDASGAFLFALSTTGNSGTYLNHTATATSLRLCDCRFTEPVFVGSGGVSSELVSGFQRGR